MGGLREGMLDGWNLGRREREDCIKQGKLRNTKM